MPLFVFTQLVIKSHKDKPMEPKPPTGARPFPTVPTVIFANWREVLNRFGLHRRAGVD